MLTLPKQLLTLFSLLVLVSCQSPKQHSESITIVDFDPLNKEKALIEQNDEAAIARYDRLVQNADSLLTCRSYSVTYKRGLPPSKDKHDYMTIGPYWWPNPDSDDQLPYIRKDGEINPETRNDFTDFVEAETFFKVLATFQKAYFYTKETAYAEKGLALIRAWFIEEETRMNPNLNYAQSIPGAYDGRKFGIIEFSKLKQLIEFIQILEVDELVDTATQDALKLWLSDYVHWLQHSELGIGECKTFNNHGTHYDGQVLSILCYLGREEEVKQHLKTVSIPRIFSQIEPDGSQPLELQRTKAFSYSVMNLHGFLYLSYIGKLVDVDVWGAESEDGRSIKLAFDYLISYLTEAKAWEYPQIVDIEKYQRHFIAYVKQAERHFGDDVFNHILDDYVFQKIRLIQD